MESVIERCGRIGNQEGTGLGQHLCGTRYPSLPPRVEPRADCSDQEDHQDPGYDPGAAQTSTSCAMLTLGLLALIDEPLPTGFLLLVGMNRWRESSTAAARTSWKILYRGAPGWSTALDRTQDPIPSRRELLRTSATADTSSKSAYAARSSARCAIFIRDGVTRKRNTGAGVWCCDSERRPTTLSRWVRTMRSDSPRSCRVASRRRASPAPTPRPRASHDRWRYRVSPSSPGRPWSPGLSRRPSPRRPIAWQRGHEARLDAHPRASPTCKLKRRTALIASRAAALR